MRNLIWRLLSNCLPSLKALNSKHIDVDNTCAICKQETEDDAHAIYACMFAKTVWAGSNFGDHSTGCRSIIEWWNNLLARNSNAELEEVVAIVWCIWQHRNAVVGTGKHQPAQRILQQSSRLHTEWQNANSNTGNQAPNAPAANNTLAHQNATSQQLWTKPETGYFKCNVDAGISIESAKMGFGCIIRNSEGVFITAKHGSYEGTFSPIVAEAIGIREALSWIKEQELEKVYVETDSEILAAALNKAENDSSVVGLIIQDCISLQRDIDQCGFGFARRSANGVAHLLARAALSKSGQECWDLSPPSFILNALYDDLI